MYRRPLRAAVFAAALIGLTATYAADVSADDGLLSINARTFAIPVQVAAGDPEVAEVRLYLSDDAGKTWRLHERSRPPLDEFVFEAPRDAEYWFYVRTADKSGRESADGRPEPELKVAVDTTPPAVDAKAERTDAGDVRIQWRVDDLNAADEPPTLKYRTDGEQRWHDVEPVRSNRNGDFREMLGTVEFQPPAGAETVFIRIASTDLAGNNTTKEIAAAAPPTFGLPDSLTTLPTEPTRSIAATSTPRPNQASPGGEPKSGLTMPRDPSRPLMVNSPSFELDYDVDRVPISAIEKVELWGTRDEGQTWLLLGVDEDRRSPCTVNVEREGNYGFAVVVTATGGVSGRRPRNGEPPEIRVGVDLTAPQVRLTTAEPDPAGRPNAMKINWSAADAHLGSQAVSLAYASSKQGPWLPLALGVANDGGRVCEFDPQSPDMVYLRIEVRDEAGNLGAFSTTAPIPLEKRQVNFRFAGAGADDRPQPSAKWFHVLR